MLLLRVRSLTLSAAQHKHLERISNPRLSTKTKGINTFMRRTLCVRNPVIAFIQLFRVSIIICIFHTGTLGFSRSKLHFQSYRW